jgi:5-methyltetrahydrofolate--homocysteine methyltransferase
VELVSREAVKRWGEQLSIGFTDLGGNLDILSHLRGTQQLLLDLIDHPGEVDRVVLETRQLWLQCYEALYAHIVHSRGVSCWGPCWSPTRGYLLQSDFSYMISPAMFERFVLPELSDCCDALDFPFYHLDGRGQLAHLDMLLSVKRLRGIQWVPGDGQLSAEHWLSLIQRIRASGKLCQVYVGARGALDIVCELGGKGLLLVINEALPPHEGQALLDEIRLLEGAN